MRAAAVWAAAACRLSSELLRLPNVEVTNMDLLMILFTLLFFAVAIGYTTACDKLK